jgi:DNA invertase Pin-like site-specific DNA recombinase
VSTDGQEVSGLGLADQEEKIRAYCGLYGLELVAVHKDAASGKDMRRPGLQEALAVLRRGEASGIVVAKLDRLTRSVRDMGILLDKYFREKFAFFVVAEQIDTRTAAGRLLLNLLASVAEWERETIGERTKAALSVKHRNGEKTGGYIPFGFDADAQGRLVPNAAEQAAIQTILQLRADGYSFQRIANALNADGILTKQGRPWSKAGVFKVYQYNKAA